MKNPTPLSTRQNTRLSSSQVSAAAHRAITNHRVFARHDGNWHRDWNKNHFHNWNGHWWGWYSGNWIGFDSGFYPFDDWAYGNYPSDDHGSPYSYYGGYSPNNYDYDPYEYDDSSYPGSDQYSNSIVTEVQSKLAKLGYYQGPIDGIEGDQTEASIARYQQDRDLSVTGTVTAATLDSLGLTQTASSAMAR
jgi:hypothetical protein